MKYLFLGAGPSQISPIVYLKNKGVKNIYTLDNNRKNIGHKYAKKSFDISILDTESIITVIKKHKIQCVLSYGSDIGAISQSILSQEGQFKNPDQSIRKLTNKYLFRKFLNETNVQKIFFLKTNKFDKKLLHGALKSHYPVISKPIIGSGSRGVRIIKNKNDLELIRDSFHFANKDPIIIEKKLKFSGKQLCGDGYFYKNKLLNFSVGDGWHNKKGNTSVPYAETFPTVQTKSVISKSKLKIEAILKKVGFIKGPINFDILIVNKKPFVIELAPRPGGNFLSEVIKLHSGIDLVSAFIKTYNRKDYVFTQKVKFSKFAASYMIHSKVRGKFDNLEISSKIKKFIFKKVIFVKRGDPIQEFKKGSDSIGNLQLIFPNNVKMQQIMKRINYLVRVICL